MLILGCTGCGLQGRGASASQRKKTPDSKAVARRQHYRRPRNHTHKPDRFPKLDTCHDQEECCKTKRMSFRKARSRPDSSFQRRLSRLFWHRRLFRCRVQKSKHKLLSIAPGPAAEQGACEIFSSATSVKTHTFTYTYMI